MLHRRFGEVLRGDVNEQVCEGLCGSAGQRAVRVSNTSSLVDLLSKVISIEIQ